MESPVYIHKTSLALLLLNICRVIAETGTRLKEVLAFKATLKDGKAGSLLRALTLTLFPCYVIHLP